MGGYPGLLFSGLCLVLVLLSGGGGWNIVVEAQDEMNPPDMSATNSNIDALFLGLQCTALVAENVKHCVADLAESSNHWNLCTIVNDAWACYKTGFDACKLKLDPRLKDDFFQGYNKGISDSDECSTSSSFTFRSSPYSVPLIILGIILGLTCIA